MSTSRRQIGREWTLQDYFAQMDFWAEIPPLNVSLAIIARAHGAKFEGARPRRVSQADQEAELTALLASIPMKPTPRRK